MCIHRSPVWTVGGWVDTSYNWYLYHNKMSVGSHLANPVPCCCVRSSDGITWICSREHSTHIYCSVQIHSTFYPPWYCIMLSALRPNNRSSWCLIRSCFGRSQSCKLLPASLFSGSFCSSQWWLVICPSNLVLWFETWRWSGEDSSRIASGT